jgi:hypothetical protein
LPATAARRAVASPVTRSGYFKVVKTDGESTSDAGFVRKDFNTFGEYGLTGNVENALPISFATSPGDSTVFDIANHNQDQSSTYPFVGLSRGFASTSDDLSRGSYNYAYLTGVQAGKNAGSDNKPNSFTGATGIPVSSQSTVWKYDAVSNELTAEWVNSDDSEYRRLPCSLPLLLLSDPFHLQIRSQS